jgi:hypothetical protein
MIDKRSPAAYAMESLFNVVEVFINTIKEIDNLFRFIDECAID